MMTKLNTAMTVSDRIRNQVRKGLTTTVAMTAGLSLALGSGTARADQKIDASLKSASGFLLAQQQPKGMFGTQFPMAMTSLAILSLAAAGNQPSDPTPQGQAMRKGIDFILLPENQTKDGYFGKVDN